MTNATMEKSEAPQSSRWLRADTLADSVVILLAVTVVQRAVGFGRGIFFCRWLDPETLGQWELAFSFLMLAAPIVVLGLPGSFGRYLEYFRARRQTRTFLRRTTLWIAGLGVVAVAILTTHASWLANLVFGQSDLAMLALAVAATLAIVIVHHYIESLFAALRMFRVVSGMHFFQSLLFATISLTLIATTELGALSVVLGYGIASLITASVSTLWLGAAIRELPAEEPTVPQRTFWAKLLPFALWVWAANVLANLFAVVDRYMIIHFSSMDESTALAQIGNYHSSLILPLLLVGVAEMISSMLTPHLSHDWESGRRDDVSHRLNLALKLGSIGLLGVSFCVLVVSPLLFSWAFAGKYGAGADVMPWTLTYCVWAALALLAQNYLWCAEKARLSSLALLVGLVANVVLNIVLVPRFGLMGAVLGTTAANAVVLGMILLLNRVVGMHLDGATIVLCLCPLVLGFGPWAALIVLVGVVMEAFSTERIFNQREKTELWELAHLYLERIGRLVGRLPAGDEASAPMS